MGTPRHIFARLQEEGWAYVDHLINEESPETLHLEGKQKRNADRAALSKKDKQNLGKALSGFANSEGGVLIWGLVAERRDDTDVICDAKPIGELDLFLAKLRERSIDQVNPPVPGVEFHAMKRNSNADQGLVAMLIPQSSLAPHMCIAKNDHRFYDRSGDRFLKMERYRVGDLFGRRPRPKVEIEVEWSAQSYLESGKKVIKVRLDFSLKVTGNAVVEHPALTLRFDNREAFRKGAGYGFSWGQAGGVLLHADPPIDWDHRRANPGAVLYPGDRHSIERPYVQFPADVDASHEGLRFSYIAHAANMKPVEGECHVELDDVFAAVP